MQLQNIKIHKVQYWWGGAACVLTWQKVIRTHKPHHSWSPKVGSWVSRTTALRPGHITTLGSSCSAFSWMDWAEVRRLIPLPVTSQLTRGWKTNSWPLVLSNLEFWWSKTPLKLLSPCDPKAKQLNKERKR